MYRTDGESGSGLTPPNLGPHVPSERRYTNFRSTGFALKRVFDLSAAVLLLLALLPLFAVLAFGVKWSSPGPIIYSQMRLGRAGREFKFFKFRSMKVDSEHLLSSFLDSDPGAMERWKRYQKIDNDPRITRFGRFIRRTSLDELPQLLNVVRGDMSLVGPRPCMSAQRHFYGKSWDDYCSVRPGLTGLWQVSGRNRLTYSQRVELDVRYVADWSFSGDIAILLRTVKVVVSGDGSH